MEDICRKRIAGPAPARVSPPGSAGSGGRPAPGSEGPRGFHRCGWTGPRLWFVSRSREAKAGLFGVPRNQARKGTLKTPCMSAEWDMDPQMSDLPLVSH